jgi:hypothetical protein
MCSLPSTFDVVTALVNARGTEYQLSHECHIRYEGGAYQLPCLDRSCDVFVHCDFYPKETISGDFRANTLTHGYS